MKLIALDVGTKRIGVAKADTSVRIAVPYSAVEVDGNEFKKSPLSLELGTLIASFWASPAITKVKRPSKAAMFEILLPNLNAPSLGLKFVFRTSL